MTTCREIIADALGEIGVIGEGQTPTAAATANALPVLQSIYDGWVSAGTFGRATEVLESAAYTAEEGDRIANTEDAEITITLPETITDVDTGEERVPRDYSLVRIAGATPQTYIRSAPLGAWQRMTSLTLNDDAPLAERSRYGLSCALAVRLARRYGAQIDGTADAAAAFRSLLTNKFDAPRTETQADYF